MNITEKNIEIFDGGSIPSSSQLSRENLQSQLSLNAITPMPKLNNSKTMNEVNLFEIEEVPSKKNAGRKAGGTKKISQNQSERIIMLPQKSTPLKQKPHYLGDTQRSHISGSPLKPPVHSKAKAKAPILNSANKKVENEPYRIRKPTRIQYTPSTGMMVQSSSGPKGLQPKQTSKKKRQLRQQDMPPNEEE